MARRWLLTPVIALLALAGLGVVPANAAAVTTLQPGGFANGRVNDFARIGSTLYAGGTFTGVKNAPGTGLIARQNLAAFNATTGAVDTSFTSGTPSQVRALEAGGGTLFAGGDFGLRAFTSGGQSVSVPTISGSVRTLTARGGWLYVGGSFSLTVSGKVKNNALRMSLSTRTIDPVWKANTNGTVKSLDVTDDGTSVFMAGPFTKVNSVNVVNLARVSTSGSGLQPFPFTPPPPDPQGRRGSRYVETYANRVVVAWTDGVNLTEVYDLASAATLKSWQADGDVQVIRVIGNDLYLAGHWVKFLGPKQWRRYAAFNASTLQAAASFNLVNEPAMGGFAIESDGGSGVWFGGDTTSVNGTNVGRMFRMT
jgi:hypothetical protein